MLVNTRNRSRTLRNSRERRFDPGATFADARRLLQTSVRRLKYQGERLQTLALSCTLLHSLVICRKALMTTEENCKPGQLHHAVSPGESDMTLVSFETNRAASRIRESCSRRAARFTEN